MRRLPLYKTQGIVLTRRPLGEKDKLALLYTSRYGKIETQGKGARKVKSRFSSSLEPFSLIDVSIWFGEKVSIIREVQIIRSFSILREDLARMELASFIARTTNSMVPFSEPDRNLFHLLLKTLLLIEENPNCLIKPYFTFKFTSILGFLPELERCICCSKPKEGGFGINPEKGGLVCKEHLDNGFRVSKPAISVISGLIKTRIESLKRITIADCLFKEIEYVSSLWLSWHISG